MTELHPTHQALEAAARDHAVVLLAAQLRAAMLDAIAGLDLDEPDIASGAYYAASTTADMRARDGATEWGACALLRATAGDLAAAHAAVAAIDPAAGPAPCGGPLLAAVEASLSRATGLDADIITAAVYYAASALAGSSDVGAAAAALVATAGVEAALRCLADRAARLAAQADHEADELAARLATFGPVATRRTHDTTGRAYTVFAVELDEADPTLASDLRAIEAVGLAAGLPVHVTRLAPEAPAPRATSAANDGGAARAPQHQHATTPPASSPRPTRTPTP